jgi:poly(3-hydroxybutyrate) depolymerase
MKEFYRFSIVGFLCLFLAFSPSSAAFSQVQTPRHISTGPRSNGFYEYLPAGYNSGSKTYPLMIFIGGVGEMGDGGAELIRVLDNGPPFLISQGLFPTSFTVNGTSYSFIIISPQFQSSNYPEASDIDSVINYAIRNYRVDIRRIYLTGLSMGGGATWLYPGTSSVYANRLAGILPTAAPNSITNEWATNIAGANLPVYVTHDIDDPETSYTVAQANVAAINAVIPPPAIKAIDTIFPAGDGHSSWLKTYNPTITNASIGNLNAYQWMLQFTRDPGTVLPITLASFTATLSQDASQVLINWATTMEMNNKYFILQRAGDGNQFTGLDTIPSTGQPGGDRYTYTDRSPLAGNDFYRLSQVDLDGKATFSAVLKVNATRQGRLGLQLSPNPGSGMVYLELVHPEQGSLQVSLTDVQGKLLRHWVFQKRGLIWDQSLDLGNLAAGSYFLQVRGTTIREVRTFIKK